MRDIFHQIPPSMRDGFGRFAPSMRDLLQIIASFIRFAFLFLAIGLHKRGIFITFAK